MNDKIKCALCGFEGKRLTTHIIHKHKMKVAAYKEKFGPIISPGESAKQAERVSKRNRTPEAREASSKGAKKVNERYASDPDFKARVDQSKKDGWTEEARARYGKVSSALRKEEWKDEIRCTKGAKACRAILLVEWKKNRKRRLAAARLGLEAARTPEAQAKRSKTLSKNMKKRWAEDDGTWLRAIMGNYRTHKRLSYKGAQMRSSWEVAFATLLDEEGMSWTYEDVFFPYNFEGKDRRYVPDFWVEDLQCFVELHPRDLVDSKMEAKIQAVRDAGCALLLIEVPPPYSLADLEA